jgi:hypothetical protein
MVNVADEFLASGAKCCFNVLTELVKCELSQRALHGNIWRVNLQVCDKGLLLMPIDDNGRTV